MYGGVLLLWRRRDRMVLGAQGRKLRGRASKVRKVAHAQQQLLSAVRRDRRPPACVAAPLVQILHPALALA